MEIFTRTHTYNTMRIDANQREYSLINKCHSSKYTYQFNIAIQANGFTNTHWKYTEKHADSNASPVATVIIRLVVYYVMLVVHIQW